MCTAIGTRRRAIGALVAAVAGGLHERGIRPSGVQGRRVERTLVASVRGPSTGLTRPAREKGQQRQQDTTPTSRHRSHLTAAGRTGQADASPGPDGRARDGLGIAKAFADATQP
jgi:hypothetical protein